jgi:hypothetical protein
VCLFFVKCVFLCGKRSVLNCCSLVCLCAIVRNKILARACLPQFKMIVWLMDRRVHMMCIVFTKRYCSSCLQERCVRCSVLFWLQQSLRVCVVQKNSYSKLYVRASYKTFSCNFFSQKKQQLSSREDWSSSLHCCCLCHQSDIIILCADR